MSTAAPALAQQLTFTCPGCRQKVDRLFEDKRTAETVVVCIRCLAKRFLTKEGACPTSQS